MSVRRRRHNKRKLNSEINVVPYIDVMLVLLVIFMVTAPLLSQGVQIDLPDASAQSLPAENSETLVVSLNDAGEVFINLGDEQSTSVSREKLLAQVTQIMSAKPSTPIYVQASATIPYEKVLMLIADLQNSGALRLGLLSEPLLDQRP